jgi:hypothetical protein
MKDEGPEKIVIVHLGQYWRFYFPCFFGTRGGRSPTPSAQKAGRKTNNVARGAHIAYCTEGKTRVFHQSVMKSCQKTKNGKNWPNVHPVFFPPSGKKKKMRVFFSSGFAFIFPPGRENSGKTRNQRENKGSENMTFRHIAHR